MLINFFIIILFTNLSGIDESKLIAMLGDNDFHIRESATFELIKRGKLINIIKTFKSTNDLEVEIRCRFILKEIAKIKPLDEVDVDIGVIFDDFNKNKERFKNILEKDYGKTFVGFILGMNSGCGYAIPNCSFPFKQEDNLSFEKDKIEASLLSDVEKIEQSYKFLDFKEIEIYEKDYSNTHLDTVQLSPKSDDIVIVLVYNDKTPSAKLYVFLQKVDGKYRVRASTYQVHYENHEE